MTTRDGGPVRTNKDSRGRIQEIAKDILQPAAAELGRQVAYPFDHARLLARKGKNGMTIPMTYCGGGEDVCSIYLAVCDTSKACGTSGRIIVDTNMGAFPAILADGSETRNAERRLVPLPLHPVRLFEGCRQTEAWLGKGVRMRIH